jgi:hypothetical protein
MTSISLSALSISPPSPPVTRLPSEVVSHIFSSLLNPSLTRSKQFQLSCQQFSKLAIVCRAWTYPAQAQLGHRLVFDTREGIERWLASATANSTLAELGVEEFKPTSSLYDYEDEEEEVEDRERVISRFATEVLEFTRWFGEGRRGRTIRQEQVVAVIERMRGLKELVIGDLGGLRDTWILADESLDGPRFPFPFHSIETDWTKNADLATLNVRFCSFAPSTAIYAVPMHLTTLVTSEFLSPLMAQLIEASSKTLVDLTLFFASYPPSHLSRQIQASSGGRDAIGPVSGHINALRHVARRLQKLKLLATLSEESQEVLIPSEVLKMLGYCRQLTELQLCCPSYQLRIALPLLRDPLNKLTTHLEISESDEDDDSMMIECKFGREELRSLLRRSAAVRGLKGWNTWSADIDPGFAQELGAAGMKWVSGEYV